jgi:hypothetical protein
LAAFSLEFKHRFSFRKKEKWCLAVSTVSGGNLSGEVKIFRRL